MINPEIEAEEITELIEFVKEGLRLSSATRSKLLAALYLAIPAAEQLAAKRAGNPQAEMKAHVKQAQMLEAFMRFESEELPVEIL